MRESERPVELKLIRSSGLDLTLYPAPEIHMLYGDGAGREFLLAVDVWRIFEINRKIYLTASCLGRDDVWDYRLDHACFAQRRDERKIPDLLSYLKEFADPPDMPSDDQAQLKDLRLGWPLFLFPEGRIASMPSGAVKSSTPEGAIHICHTNAVGGGYIIRFPHRN